MYVYNWTRQTLCTSSLSRYSSPLSHLRSPLRAPNTNSYHPKHLPRLLQRVTGECFGVRLIVCADVHGLRFVEHFSPYCHHCRAFAPTWDELVDDYAGSPINLAQVDCIVHGGKSGFVFKATVPSETPTDLCNENGVKGYPQMNLYHDGAFKLMFEGVRSHERIVSFLKEHTEVSEPSRNEPPPDLPEHDLQTPHSQRNPHGEVLVLTPETFPNVVANGDVFVKFYAPW